MSRRPKVVPLAEATAALADAERVLSRWQGEAAERAKSADLLAAELAEQEARAGDDLLAADEDDQGAVAAVAERLTRLRTEQALAVQAANTARSRLDDARRAMLAAMAEAVRSRAQQLREAAARRQARTDQMLAELAEWERVQYDPAPRPPASGVGTPFRSVPLTELVSRRATWLAQHADHLAYLASEGAADQVLSAVNAGQPEPLDIEALALDDQQPAAA